MNNLHKHRNHNRIMNKVLNSIHHPLKVLRRDNWKYF